MVWNIACLIHPEREDADTVTKGKTEKPQEFKKPPPLRVGVPNDNTFGVFHVRVFLLFFLIFALVQYRGDWLNPSVLEYFDEKQLQEVKEQNKIYAITAWVPTLLWEDDELAEECNSDEPDMNSMYLVFFFLVDNSFVFQ